MPTAAEKLGQNADVDLYNNFVTDTLATLKKLNVNFKIVFDPPGAKDQFQQWLGKEYRYVPQIGQNLGKRMKNAFLQTFSKGPNSVVIIGSDSPDLPAEYLEIAFRVLDADDVAIGPSSDGGYYLIGFAKDTFSPDVFDGIRWGGSNVFKQTIDILKQGRRSFYLLPQWYDVDNIADLKSLLQRSENTDFSKSETIRYLTEHKLGERFNV